MNRQEAEHQKATDAQGSGAKAREVHRRGGQKEDNEYLARVILTRRERVGQP